MNAYASQSVAADNLRTHYNATPPTQLGTLNLWLPAEQHRLLSFLIGSDTLKFVMACSLEGMSDDFYKDANHTLTLLGQYSALHDVTVKLEPHQAVPYYDTIASLVTWRGQLENLYEHMESLPAGLRGDDPITTHHLLITNFEQVEQKLRDQGKIDAQNRDSNGTPHPAEEAASLMQFAESGRKRLRSQQESYAIWLDLQKAKLDEMETYAGFLNPPK